jgi:hypothetical protein
MGRTLTPVRGADNGYIPAAMARPIPLQIDYLPVLCHTASMTRSARKFIAIIMLLWLPVFTGSALATSVSMQLPQGECHDAAMSHEAMSMDMAMDMNMDMANISMDEHRQVPAGDHSPSCNDCGVCHLACTGYLAVTGIPAARTQAAAREITPYLVVFNSVTSVPLLPPPLVRA